jgi:two-component system, OmpR family, osmolarity sensor histidine kinase EnvZ
MTKVLGRSLSNEIGLVIALYEKSDKSPAAIKELERIASERLRLKLDIERNKPLPEQGSIPFYALFETKMQKYLARETGRSFYVDSNAENQMVDIRVEVEKGLVFHFLTEEERAYAANTPLFLGLMLASTLLLTAIAATFLGKQVKPILDLARAANAFGLGRDVSNYVPRGAAEIRVAGDSFINMKRRIARYVDQRTTMLAGVSHDLRTIITRFKLELAMLGDNKKLEPLKRDVDDMQRMLEDYLNFAKGDGDEQSTEMRVRDAIEAAVSAMDRSGKRITIRSLPELRLQLKPNAFRRLLDNVFGNALRYGAQVEVSGTVKEERLWIYVDDDGPGIPEAQRDDVFKPFFRLDEARNIDETGTGLGLAIALDIAHAHGGDILLEGSPLGGLRVAVKVPV